MRIGCVVESYRGVVLLGFANCAGFIRGLSLGWAPLQCARLGNAAAALVAQGLGSDAGIENLEATLRFRIRAIFLTGVLFFASPRSLCFSAAVHTLSSVRSARSPRSRLLSASLFNPCVLIGARGGQAAGVMSMQT